MRLQFFPEVSILLASTLLSAEATSTPPSGERVLRAATRSSDLYRRSNKIEKKYSASLSYVDGANGQTVFASQVKVGSERPVLKLEDIDHHLQDVECKGDSMKLRFGDKVHARDTRNACHGGVIITSHEGCNAEGERSFYKVDKVDEADDGLTLDLIIISKEWEEAFSSVTIDFGSTDESHIIRRHEDFRKLRMLRRQDPTPTAPPQMLALSVPTDDPADIKNATLDIASSNINTTFGSDRFLSGLADLTAQPDLPVDIGCKNCTTTGNIVLSRGSIDVDMSTLIFGIDKGHKKPRLSAIKSGFFELAANDVSAHIELFAQLKRGGSYDIEYLAIPVVGFAIPNVGKAGLTYTAAIHAAFNMSDSPLELNTGFAMKVPEKSSIRLDLANLPASGIFGFPNTTLTPLPTMAGVSDLDMFFDLSMRAAVNVGFDVLSRFQAEVSINLDLPKSNLRLTTEPDPSCAAPAPLPPAVQAPAPAPAPPAAPAPAPPAAPPAAPPVAPPAAPPAAPPPAPPAAPPPAPPAALPAPEVPSNPVAPSQGGLTPRDAKPLQVTAENIGVAIGVEMVLNLPLLEPASTRIPIFETASTFDKSCNPTSAPSPIQNRNNPLSDNSPVPALATPPALDFRHAFPPYPVPENDTILPSGSGAPSATYGFNPSATYGNPYSTATGTGAGNNSLPEFTGSAAKTTMVSPIFGGSLVWQSLVVSLAALAGAMCVL
ncbi:hypothetical protein BU24DRAFT_465450 [Aaosphaeria arxii CBS 175.79]|uniref:Uncharacterized protein n=1 Tax=Aaosphaeria arxii CBS 175.79 TaxID=1450172 RepID=A0A6A5XGA0_9PLEO|nr:uncharacterized protein BU24DRAFT_465450 [Aaosphaeria arxii CBS 175.79]KAF2011857.1 hypothetical protein BU24DRAFT_465450 [Aaosphaeria arxii CBS 175.79]